MCSCTFPFHSQAKGDQQRYWEDLACPPPSTSGMCSHTFWIPTCCLSAYSCSSPTCHQGVKQKENPRGVLAWWATCVNRGALDSPGTRRPGACCTSASATMDMPLADKKGSSSQGKQKKLFLGSSFYRQMPALFFRILARWIYIKPSADARKIWNLLKNYYSCKSCFDEFIAN